MKNRLAPFWVIIAASLWGVDGIVLTPELFTLPVSLVVFLNSFIVAVILLPILISKFSELKKIKIQNYFSFFIVALLGGAIGTMAITKALFFVNFVNLSIVMLIQKLQPIFAIVMASLILKERLPIKFFILAVVAIIGAYFMAFGFNLPNFNTGDKTLEAAGFALLAAISFGASTVFSKKALKNVSFEMGTYLRFLFTAILMGIILGFNAEYNAFGSITEKQYLIFGIIAITTGAPAIFLYYYGLKKISASVSTICELAFPLTAVLLEYILRDNILSAVQWIGVAILIFSIIQVTRINYTKKKNYNT